jgi:Flp pilus assembly protein TadG
MFTKHRSRCRPAGRRPHRPGATVVECAIVLPVTFFLLFALVVGAMGIFRYQEVASLAREGARYASTHGYQYRKDAGLPMGTTADWKTDIYNNAILPKVVALDVNQLSFDASWPDVINQPGKPDNWPGSKVDVTVTYNWLPELYLIGPIRLTSTSSMPITN